MGAPLMSFRGWEEPDGSIMQDPKQMTINLLAVGCVIPKEDGIEVIVQGRPLWLKATYNDFCAALAAAHGLNFTPDPPAP